MNKYKQLTKTIIKLGVIAAIIIAVFVGIYIGISTYADGISENRKKVESQYTQDQGLLADLRKQMDMSGEAEKRYIAIQSDRTNQDFAATMDGPDGLNAFLRDAKTRYHFDKLTIKPVKEVPSDKPELSNFPYNVVLRPHLVIQFQAVSDTHVFSFIDDLYRAAPGFIRIDKVELKRIADLSDTSLTQLQSGTSPILVTASIEFTWIRITPKETKDAKGGVAGTAATPAALAPPPPAPTAP